MALQPYLQIGTNNLDNFADINSISCTHGRVSVSDQPGPSTFNCVFYLAQTEYIDPITIGSPINWRIDNPTSGLGNSDVFIGTVSDISTSLEWGGGNGFFKYTVTGVGRLANLNKQLVGWSGYAKQYDGTRIAAILTDCAETTTYISAPGAYELAVYSSSNGPTNALALAQEAANSAMGCLYEFCQDNGLIRYQSYLDRSSNPEIILTGADILANSYQIGISGTSIANQVTLSYGTGSLGTTYDDAISQTTYGVLAGERATTLHNVSDANSQAQTLLAARANPTWDLQTITINLATVSDTLRNELLQMFVGTQIRIDSLPTPELGSFHGFIEGYTWHGARNFETVTLNVSNYGKQYPYTLWNAVPNTETWNSIYTSTTTWEMVD